MTAREYIYRMLDTYHIPNSDWRMVNASEKQIETVMLAFAKDRVQDALDAVKRELDDSIVSNCSDHTPFWGTCVSCGRYDNPAVVRDVDELKLSISNCYPIENVK